MGTFQLFAVSALMVVNVPGEPWLALANLPHFIQYIMVTTIGIVLINRECLCLGRLLGQVQASAGAASIAASSAAH